MANLTPLQLFDIQNLKRELGEEDEIIKDDPFTAAALASPRLSQSSKAFLRQQELRRQRRIRLENELRQIERERQRPGIVSTIGGVPIGFQFGTAAGLEGIPALLVDILFDPVNLIGVGTVGKLGRAANFLKGLSPAKKADQIIDVAKTIARAGTDKAFLDDLIRATERAAKPGGSADELLDLFKVGRKEVSEDTFRLLDDMAREGNVGAQDLGRLLRNERTARKEMSAAFEREAKDLPLQKAEGFLNQVKSGQRSLLSLGVPGFGHPVEIFTLRNLGDELGIQRFVTEAGFETAEAGLRNAIDFRGISEAAPGVRGSVFAGQPVRVAQEVASATPGQVFDAASETAQLMRGEQKLIREATESITKSIDDTFGGISKAEGLSREGVEEVLTGAILKLDSPKGVKVDDLLKTLRKARSPASAARVPDEGLLKLIKRQIKPDDIGRLEEFLSTVGGRETLEQLAALVQTKRLLENTSGILERGISNVGKFKDLEKQADQLVGTIQDIESNSERLRQAKKGFRPLRPDRSAPRGGERFVEIRGSESLRRQRQQDLRKLYAQERDRLRNEFRKQFGKISKEAGFDAQVKKELNKAFNVLIRPPEGKQLVAPKLKDFEVTVTGRAGDAKILIGDALRQGARRAVRVAEKEGLPRQLRDIPAQRVSGGKDIAESHLSAAQRADGTAASPAMREIMEQIARDEISGQTFRDLQMIGRDFEELRVTAEQMRFMGDDPRGLVLRAGELEAGYRSQSNLIARRVETYVGGNEEILKRVALAVDDPGMMKGLSPQLRGLADILRQGFNDLGRVMHEDEMFDVFVNDYFPRILVRKTKRGDELMKSFIIQNINRLKDTARTRERKFFRMKDTVRFVENNKEHIDFARDAAGRTAERADVGIQLYGRMMGQAYLRWNTFKQLARMNAPDGKKLVIIGNISEGAVTRRGVPAGDDLLAGLGYNAEQMKDIRETYQTIDHYIKNLFKDYHIHPSLAQSVKNLFDRNFYIDPEVSQNMVPFLGKKAVAAGKTGHDRFFNSLQFFSEFGRTALFRMSMVHGNSLMMSLIPGLNLFNWRTGKMDLSSLGRAFQVSFGALRLPGSVGAISLKMMEKVAAGTPGMGTEFVDMSDIVARWLRTGTNIARPEFQAFDHFGNAVRRLASSDNPLVRAAGIPLEAVNDLFDKNLWDSWHVNMKFLYFVQQRAAFIARNHALLQDAARLQKVEREIARFGDQIMGGLAWNQLGMFGHPKMRQFLSFALIAPDWTMSNLLIARDFIFTMPGIRNTRLAKLLTPDVLMADVRFKMARQYVFRTAVYAFLWGNALNYAFTGKALWDAEPEAVDTSTGLPRVELPYRRHDGRKQYMDWLKQFVEPIEWVRPLYTGDLRGFQEFIFPKLGALPRLGGEVLVGYNPSMGRVTLHEEDGPLSQFYKVGSSGLSPFVPIPMQQAFQVMRGSRDWRSATISSFGFPVRTESRSAAATREYEEAINAALQTGDLQSVNIKPRRGPEPTEADLIAELEALGGRR